VGDGGSNLTDLLQTPNAVGRETQGTEAKAPTLPIGKVKSLCSRGYQIANTRPPRGLHHVPDLFPISGGFVVPHGARDKYPDRGKPRSGAPCTKYAEMHPA